MRKYLTEFDQLVGKTIEATIELNCERIFTFTDGTYASIRSGPSWEGDRGEPELIQIGGSGYSYDHAWHVLVDIGIYTQAEFDQWTEKQNRILVDSAIRLEAEERAQLVRLKKKYE